MREKGGGGRSKKRRRELEGGEKGRNGLGSQPCFGPSLTSSFLPPQVTEFDCLLLEHVFGNRPDDCHKVKAYVLETIASDPGLQQAELVFLGLFGRALRLLSSCEWMDGWMEGDGSIRARKGESGRNGGRRGEGMARREDPCTHQPSGLPEPCCLSLSFSHGTPLLWPHAAKTGAPELAEAVQEAGALASLLRSRHASLALSLDAGFPELKSSVWQSEAATQAAVQGLTPQMTENRKKVGRTSEAEARSPSLSAALNGSRSSRVELLG